MTVVHRCPDGDEVVTPCCQRLVFELPRDEQLTTDEALVNCPARS